MPKPGDVLWWCHGCRVIPETTVWEDGDHNLRHQGPMLPHNTRVTRQDPCNGTVMQFTVPEGLGTCDTCQKDFCWLQPGETTCTLCQITADEDRERMHTDAYALIYRKEYEGHLSIIGPFTDKGQDKGQGDLWLHDLSYLMGLNGKYAEWEAVGWVYGFEPIGRRDAPFDGVHSPWLFIDRLLGSWFCPTWVEGSGYFGVSHMEVERVEVSLAKSLARKWLLMGIPKLNPSDRRD